MSASDSLDMTSTVAPKSDQLNADDMIAGSMTFTIERVTAGSDEQPVNVHLVELPGRPYRPSKSMRRVLVAAWGKEASEYAGRRLTLYRDPEVTFGRDKVGGIKISHLSHIEKRLAIALTVTRGRRSPHVVEVLREEAVVQTATAGHLGAIKEHMGRAGMTPGNLLKVASDQVGRVVGHPGELTVAEADALIEHLGTLPGVEGEVQA